MKRISLLVCVIISLSAQLISQSDAWPVMAVMNSSQNLQVNVYLNDGTAIPVVAIFEDGNDHFMDVKAVHKGEKISIKLISSNDLLVPVKGISRNGDVYKVKATTGSGRLLDVKGVSRDGNTLNLAAISADGKNNMPLMALSPDGLQRPVKGVKFRGHNVEMEFGEIQVIGHVKALPIVDVGDVESDWAVIANTHDGEQLRLYAISKEGKEYPVNAEMEGNHPYLMNVRAHSRMIIHIKLVKKDGAIVLGGIDAIGRLYDVMAKSDNGDLFKVVGERTKAKIAPIYAVGNEGQKYPVKALSSLGDEFDVKGLKVKEDDVEDIISGLNVWIRYYAHVKAMAPAK